MTLKYTLAEVRTRELAHVKTVGRPTPWWPGGMTTNDCVGYQTDRLGLRTGEETWAELTASRNRHLISIAAFRAHYQFTEVSPDRIAPGDLVISNWTGTRIDGDLEAEHMEWAYSTSDSAIVIVGANTGPRPGDPTPNGVWRKTRPLDHHILFGIRLPYRPDKPSISRKHVVKTVAALVNEQVPDGHARTGAAKTGAEDRNYWWLVQTWGRMRGYYGTGYIIDGIPGSQSRIVEAAAYKASTAKK